MDILEASGQDTIQNIGTVKACKVQRQVQKAIDITSAPQAAQGESSQSSSESPGEAEGEGWFFTAELVAYFWRDFLQGGDRGPALEKINYP